MKEKVVIAIGLDLIKNKLIELSSTTKYFKIEFLEEDVVKEREGTIKLLKERAEALIVGNKIMDSEINILLNEIKKEINEIPIIPIGGEALQNNIYNIDKNKALFLNSYFSYGGDSNIKSALNYIAYHFLKLNEKEKNHCKNLIFEPEEIPFDGIFYKDNKKVFTSFKEYKNWYIGEESTEKYKWVGLLIHRSSFINNNIEVEKVLISELEAVGVKVIPVFSYASSEKDSNVKNFRDIIKEYFSYENNLIIDGFINLQMLAAIGNNNCNNIFNQAVKIFKEMNIPVFKPIISYYKDIHSWSENQGGLSQEAPTYFTIPEMAGMIEPIIIGARNKNGEYEPIGDRVKRFAGRVLKWINLRNTNNKDKKMVLFIHNAPCSGVEATIGLGAGLEVFKSSVEILKRLKSEGYFVENIPENGEELLNVIMNKKAYHDFRWTSIEDIITSGGVLYKMPLDGDGGYMSFYKNLHIETRNEIEKSWGEPPGESMVYDKDIIITGLKFGNVYIMVQPKRGCYGSKCTGEVCKILHDPKCPPPHNYIATYKYVEDIIGANAIVHIGTGSSLENLPGKTNGLSKKCYPDIVLGSTPNIYLYNAAVGTEGIVAKRRSNAVIVDYLPSAIDINIKNSKIISLINDYIEAETLNSNQKLLIKEKLEKSLKELTGAEEILSKEETFVEGVKSLKNYLVQYINNSRVEKLHVFGENFQTEENISLIKEYIDNSSNSAKVMKKLYKEDYKYDLAILDLISKFIDGDESIENQYENIEKAVLKELRKDVMEIYSNLLLLDIEMKNLINALEGKYIEPSMSGLPSENLKNIIPTGRNFYLMDCEKIPTKEAYKVGCNLAEKLIEKYVSEEGCFPEKIAMNMISTDISVTKGEQLSQILYLMGITPVWDNAGRVVDIDVIPLEELKRPRIDVTIRISGILRDSFPDAIKLMDKAIVMASSLDEPLSENFVKKNTLNIEKYLLDIGQDKDINRHATMRIFGDKPGAYGAGVDLALKASAWKDEEDIAKVFVHFSSYAYGENLNGDMAKYEFVKNIKDSQISYQTTSSKRYNILSSSFFSSVQGGFSLVKKHFDGKALKEYYGRSEGQEKVKISKTEEELKENMKDTFFNPLWKEGIKKKGYMGAAEFMNSIQNIFNWQCLCENIDSKDIDKLVDIYINDKDMLQWFKKNNKFALEEISRRFLELHERGKWSGREDVLNSLKRNYINIEGDMEEMMENSAGEIQGGAIEILNQNDIEKWKENISEVEEVFNQKFK
ncbi:cobaltochelatase subunit CobN [Clostridium butanoliproducens]|uniref:cobaltochelatase subunit CobN n=1 Tax=Clostridium butanoliproducens TaxID=2991837 RepID=UPI0024BB86E1|nr:cobaltochelatase subunit CobN [Clostridium butanoliproducens]